MKREKMDKRKNYYLILDTETANTFLNEKNQLDFKNGLVYDVGFVVCDKKGKIYKQGSYIIREVFFNNELMDTAYYKNKIPCYYQELQEGKRIITSIFPLQIILRNLIIEYNIKAVCAFNAVFDYTVLNSTVRHYSNNKNKYFFQKGVVWYDIMKIANSTIGLQKSYDYFCNKHNYKTKHKIPQNKHTAEVYYKYITNNIDFMEVHQGIDDVLIEKEIFVKSLRQHKKTNKLLWNN